jgi:hypothetical protein
MPFIDRIKNNFAEEMVNHCSERSCKLKLVGLRNYVVLKGEKFCIDRKICDCLIFTENADVLIALVELKSKNANATEIEEKLTNGLKIASSLLEKCSIEHVNFDFYLIVLSKSWRPSEYRVIVSRKVWLRGKRYDIIPKTCGLSFLDLILRIRK